MKIPTLCIFIPAAGHRHSKTLFYPRYVLTLFKRMWDPRMNDPNDLVRSIPFPQGTTPQFRYSEVNSVQEEKSFWKNYFDNAVDGLFDNTYPGSSFEAEFEKLLTDMASEKVTITPKPVAIVIPDEIKLLQQSPELSAELVKDGFKDLVSIARASLSELMEVEGMDAPTAGAIRDYATQNSEMEPVVVQE